MEEKLGYFEVPSLGTQDALLKRRSSSRASVVDGNQAPLAASAVADDADIDHDWDLEDSVALHQVKRVGTKNHLCDFQDSCRVKNCMVPVTVAEVFELTT